MIALLKAKEILSEYLDYAALELTVDEQTTPIEINTFAYCCARYYIDGMIGECEKLGNQLRVEYWFEVQIHLTLEVQLLNSMA